MHRRKIRGKQKNNGIEKLAIKEDGDTIENATVSEPMIGILFMF